MVDCGNISVSKRCVVCLLSHGSICRSLQNTSTSGGRLQKNVSDIHHHTQGLGHAVGVVSDLGPGVSATSSSTFPLTTLEPDRERAWALVVRPFAFALGVFPPFSGTSRAACLTISSHSFATLRTTQVPEGQQQSTGRDGRQDQPLVVVFAFPLCKGNVMSVRIELLTL